MHSEGNSTFGDMKKWWKHESKSLGPMIASGHLTHEKAMEYHKRLTHLHVKTEALLQVYTGDDTRHEIIMLVDKVGTLRHFVAHTLLPTFPEHKAMMLKPQERHRYRNE